MMRSYSTRPRHQGNQPSVSTSVSTAAHRCGHRGTSRQPPHAPSTRSRSTRAWINQLVRSKSTTQLADSLQPAIQRYHTVSRLRLRLVQLINHQFRAGKRAELLAHVVPSLLPCLSRSKHGSHLLYNSGLLLREDESQRHAAVLLQAHRRRDQPSHRRAIVVHHHRTAVTFSSSSWPVLRQCSAPLQRRLPA